MSYFNLKIVDHTEMDSEVLAMLQAFYSRSPMPIENRLESLAQGDGTKEENIRKAMKTYYVDYGHASIGECGGTTVFIENVSMLAAKAIQDTPLYVGQECSTRYIDFSTQPFQSSGGLYDEFDGEIQRLWRDLYVEALPQAIAWAERTYDPAVVLSSKIKPENVEKAFKATCKAIAFDVCRSLLPAGAVTSLAWTGSFRTLSEHLNFLSYHPLQEVRDIARQLYSDLACKYPSSFKQTILNPQNKVEDPEVYYNFEDPLKWHLRLTPTLDMVLWEPLDYITKSMEVSYYQRHRKPTDHSVTVDIKGRLDFGSYRDLQRHRPGLNKMPLLSRLDAASSQEFNEFYVKAFKAINPKILNRIDAILALPSPYAYLDPDEQYSLPMGLNVPVHVRWDWAHLCYVMRLRSKTSVHPSLRKFMHNVANEFERQCPDLSDFLDTDRSGDYTASDRGEQTFKRKTET